MEVYLIRHTTPAIEKGICYGQTDVPLADTFMNEAQAVVQQLPSEIEAVYTSPLQRCMQLANVIGSYFKIPIITDSRLMELNFGRWEMRRWNDISPEELDPWMNDYVIVPCPAGESYQQLAKRVGEFWKEVEKSGHQRIAVITHHGVMKASWAMMKQDTLQNAMDMHWENGAVITL